MLSKLGGSLAILLCICSPASAIPRIFVSGNTNVYLDQNDIPVGPTVGSGGSSVGTMFPSGTSAQTTLQVYVIADSGDANNTMQVPGINFILQVGPNGTAGP